MNSSFFFDKNVKDWPKQMGSLSNILHKRSETGTVTGVFLSYAEESFFFFLSFSSLHRTGPM